MTAATGDDETAQEAGSASTRRTGWGVVGARAQSTAGTVGRWAQSAALLSPNDDPTFLVVSGKTTVAGQTVDSTPSVSSAIALSLSSPISDLSSPPWVDLSSTGPISAYGSLVPLSSSSALFYGGDATGDSSVAVQTGSDSAWLLSLSSPSSATWTHETASAWPSQPQRRELAYTASATNGTLSRAWVYGGQRPDGSGTTFSELWEVQLGSSADGSVDASTASWTQCSGSDGPPAMFDGTAVLIPSSSSDALPSIYLIGGVHSASGSTSAVTLDSAWVFTPSDAAGSGSWTQVELSGDVPPSRRGHVAVEVGDGKVWVQGGRSVDGATVYGDAAVLDTRKGTWEKAKEGEEAWGRSAVAVGETVVLAFGYGANSPASTALSVYSPSNDTWLDAYYPSFVVTTTPTNPKAGSSDSSTAAAEAGQSSPTDSAASPASSPSATSSPSPDSSDADPDTSGDSTTSPQWTAPGAAPTPSSSSSPTNDDGNSSGASKSTIAGAVVGSVLGALVLGVAGAMAVRRYRENEARGQYLSSGGGYTGDEEFGGAGGVAGLMAEHRAAGGGSSEMYSLGAGAGSTAGKRLPVLPISSLNRPGGSSAAGAGGVMGALVGLLSPRERFASATAGRKRRFDMLRDEEESGVWDASLRSDRGGWEQFGDHDEKEDGRALETPSLSGRGGTGVWDGFAAGTSAGAGRFGDSLKSSTSYLGGALGGFIGLAAGSAAAKQAQRERVDDGDDEKDAYALAEPPRPYSYAEIAQPAQAYVDPALTPIVEWEEDDDETRSEPGQDDSRTLESHNTHSSATHQTASTYPTSDEVSPSKSVARRSVAAAAAAPIRPFSPTPSLYGSNFTPQPAALATLGGMHALSRTSSGTSSVAPALAASRTQSSWWSRLNKSHAGEVPTPTASEAIRDPAPAPSMAAIAEDDPFADAPTVSSGAQGYSVSRSASTRVTRPDEHGRFPSGESFTQGEHDRSVSSNTSEVTATSSVLEDRLRNMDVVQRVRTGSGGDSSVEATPTLGGNDEGTFGVLPSVAENDDPFADQPAPPSSAAPFTPAAGSVVWAGSAAGTPALSSSSLARASTPPPVPALPIIQPPTPTYAPPLSPRKARLVGPRPQPPLSPSSASAFSPRGMPARSNSVKDLVAQIERKASASGSVAGSGEGGEALSVPSTPRRKARKVEHGFAKKPVLYVANPDA
ncbi:hypothetical protein JCM10207_002396 [Rhodosporidiobolus poonsookiae]